MLRPRPLLWALLVAAAMVLEGCRGSGGSEQANTDGEDSAERQEQAELKNAQEAKADGEDFVKLDDAMSRYKSLTNDLEKYKQEVGKRLSSYQQLLKDQNKDTSGDDAKLIQEAQKIANGGDCGGAKAGPSSHFQLRAHSQQRMDEVELAGRADKPRHARSIAFAQIAKAIAPKASASSRGRR